MIMVSTIFLLLIPVILILVVGLPIIVGVCVYRDAKKRVDCSPVLWALVAALVPSFIGLVVYLIIRRDYPLKPEYGGPIGNMSGSSTGSTDWRSEGGSAYSDGQGASYYRASPDYQAADKGLPTWGKALVIIAAVVGVICLVAAIGSLLYTVFTGTSSSSEIIYNYPGY